MVEAFFLILGILFCTTLYLFRLMLNDRKKILTYEKELAEFQDLLKAEKSKTNQVPDLALLIRLKDPIKVAKRESTLAVAVENIAPNVVIRKTYDQVLSESVAMLKKRDVEAFCEIITI